VLTNACGGLRPGLSVGDPVLIKDHLNLTWRTPLVGARFVDLTDLYSSRLRALCRQVDPTLDEGVYVQFPGPHYETPAEIEMVRRIGGDLVGTRLHHLRQPVEDLAAVVRGRRGPARLRPARGADRVADVLARGAGDVLPFRLVRASRLAAREGAADVELVRLTDGQAAH